MLIVLTDKVDQIIGQACYANSTQSSSYANEGSNQARVGPEIFQAVKTSITVRSFMMLGTRTIWIFMFFFLLFFFFIFIYHKIDLKVTSEFRSVQKIDIDGQKNVPLLALASYLL